MGFMPSNMAFREILTVLADLDQRLALTGETLMQVKCRQLSFITNLKANIKKTQIINLLLYLLAFKKTKTDFKQFNYMKVDAWQ